MKLKDEEVRHIADLAKLDLTDEEVKLYAKQLTSVLEYVDQLKKLDLPGDAPQMAHALGLENVLRADEVEGCDAETRKKLIEAFPKRKGDLLESAAALDRSGDV